MSDNSELSPWLKPVSAAAIIAMLASAGLTLPDDKFFLTGSSDASKIGRFELDANTTGTTRVYSLPNATTMLAGLAVAQTFSAAQTFASTILCSSTVTADEHIWGDSATYIGKATYGASSLIIGSFSNRPLLLYTNSALAVTFGVDGSLVAAGKVASGKAAAAANITDVNSSMKFYDAGLGAGLFGMQTNAVPYAFQLQVADSSMASQFPLSLNPLGGVVNIGSGGLVDAGALSVAGKSILGATSLDATLTSNFGTPYLALVGDNNAANSLLNIDTGNTVAGPCFFGVKTRSGTTAPTTIVQNGDFLMNLSAYGADGANYRIAASIRMLVDGTPGVNDMPGCIVFYTSPDGTASPVESLRIDSAQTVIVASGKHLQLGNAYTASVLAVTGYVIIKDNTGTDRKVLCNV